MRNIVFLSLLLVCGGLRGQYKPIKIVEEEIPNRLALYAVNENEQDLDVKITISGTNFRQSRARPRFIRVPATSKVHLKTIVLMRGKKPNYTYKLEVNDSLSNRALRKEYEIIRIKPSKPVIVYFTANCKICDSLLVDMEQGKYILNSLNLAEKPEIKDQLQVIIGTDTPIDSLTLPIVNIGGKLYARFENYDQIIEAMNKE